MEKTVAIVGLGYVGLPLAELCSSKGYRVLGIDVDTEKVKLTNAGTNHLSGQALAGTVEAGSDFSVVREASVIVICVPTPLTKDKKADLSMATGACESVGEHLQKGQLVVIESTVNPNALSRTLVPALEKKLSMGDFHVVHCPERIDPGNARWNVSNIPRVLGVMDDVGRKLAVAFYSSILDAEVRVMSSMEAAEAVKMVENSFRDLNIAFVNELAQLFQKMGLDTTEIIDGASTKPFSFIPHYPGVGVGGHCIPVDPCYLIEEAKIHDVDLSLVEQGRRTNERMPAYTVSLLEGAFDKGRVGVLGLAYKKDIADDRESPAHAVISLLKSKSYEVTVYDPHIPVYSSETIGGFLRKVGAVIICTDHSAFEGMEDALIAAKVAVVIDGKNMLDGHKLKDAGVVYRGIGRF